MTSLLVAKQYLMRFYGKYEMYLLPVIKLALSFTGLFFVNKSLGFMNKIDNTVIVLVASLMCSFLPMNFILLISAAFVLLHAYALSLECAAVVLAVFLLLFLFYFRFSPKDTAVVLLLPICYWLRIPYVIPIIMGLIGSPVSAISVSCGIVVYYLITYVGDHASAIVAMEEEDATAKVRFLIDGMLNNKEMAVAIAAFAVTLILVYLIRRLSVNHGWKIAIAAGALVNMVIFLVGDMMLDVSVSSISMLLIGNIIAAAIALVVHFFKFNVDYSRIEKVQFEDDEYYYYIKAVPKITVATPERTVKRINQRKKQRPAPKTTGERRTGRAERK